MSTKLAKRLGKNIRRLRLAKGLTIEDLALANELSRGYVSELENGKKLPSLDMLEKIAVALKVDIKELF